MYRIYFTAESSQPPDLPDLTAGNSLVKSALYAPGAINQPGAVVQPGGADPLEEDILLHLEGEAGQIEDFIGLIQRALRQAEEEAAAPGGTALYLACQVTSAAAPWRARLLGGSLRLASGGADARALAAQDCVLTIRRADYWEYAAEALPLYMHNPFGSARGDYLALANHSDAAHANYSDLPAFDLALPNVQGDLPAPPLLTLGLGDPQPTRPVTFFVGESWREGVEQLPAAYAGESGTARSGVTGTVSADAACAGGQYLNLAWSGSAELDLWALDLPAADLQRLGGFPVRPLLRLQDSLSTAASEKLWYRWKVFVLRGGVEYFLADSAAQYMEQGAEIVLGPPLNLPPWLVNAETAFAVPALRLVLTVQAAGTGAHALKLDYLALLALDGWRIYRPLTAEPGRGLLDDGPRGLISGYGEDYQPAAGEGPGFLLQPGRAHRFTFFALRHDAAEKAAPIDLPMRVWLAYRPRRRTL